MRNSRVVSIFAPDAYGWRTRQVVLDYLRLAALMTALLFLGGVVAAPLAYRLWTPAVVAEGADTADDGPALLPLRAPLP